MPCHILMLSGSLRAASTNTAALRTMAADAPPEVVCDVYDRLADLPAFNPDLDGPDTALPEPAGDLRARIRAADALVVSSPEYAGALPGAFKNLLDWTIGDDRPGSIYGKPVAWVNVSPRGAAGAHEELRTVLGYAHADRLDEADTAVPLATTAVGADGLVADHGARRALGAVLERLVGRTCGAPAPPA